MQKAQRLLDLAAFLLRAAEPVSWREIQEQFPEDYGRSSGEAAIRKFERDKAELLELGIPIRYAAGDEDLPAGYLIDRDEFYLPDLKLPPEDLALLYLAGSAALAKGSFPYVRDLAHALNKLSFAARAPGAEAAASVGRRLSAQTDGEGEGETTEDERGIGARLEELSRAVAVKKRVHVAYEGAERRTRTERDVDPYGLYQKAGAWYVVGWCHLRKAIRTFAIGRIRALAVNGNAPRTPDFPAPKEFRLADYATREAWEFSVHATQRCRVRLDAPLAPEIVASFGPRARVEEDVDGAVVELDVTNGEGLVRHVLALGDRAEILGPRPLRDHARKILRALVKGLS
jgi:proteasome accessory factor B